MKMTLIPALFLAIGVNSAQAADFECIPTEADSLWQQATVQYLSGAQALRQIKATGSYLVADLICSIDNCVGFVNGIEVKGFLETDNKNQVTAVMIEADPRDLVRSGRFSCK